MVILFHVSPSVPTIGAKIMQIPVFGNDFSEIFCGAQRQPCEVRFQPKNAIFVNTNKKIFDIGVFWQNAVKTLTTVN